MVPPTILRLPTIARMSVPVALVELAERLDEFGDVAFAVTADEQAKSHVVSVKWVWQDDELVVTAGRHTCENAEATGMLTLLWPAPPGQPYSLIIDGDARAEPGDGLVALRPTRAVLHRVADADPSLASCVKLLEP